MKKNKTTNYLLQHNKWTPSVHCNTISEARIAKGSEQVSELNNHVWDSVDRIYLCKLSPLHIRRKRREFSILPQITKKKNLTWTLVKSTVTSLDASEALDEPENLYENCAVIAAQNAVTPVEDMESKWHGWRIILWINDCMWWFHAGPMDPVLVNDKIARGFASAWNVGSEQLEVHS